MSTETNKTIDGTPILRRVGTFWPLIAAIAIYLLLGGAYVQRAIPRGATNFDSANYEAMTKQWLRTGVYGYWAAKDHTAGKEATEEAHASGWGWLKRFGGKA